jgi:hypothetical protein
MTPAVAAMYRWASIMLVFFVSAIFHEVGYFWLRQSTVF